MSIGCFLVSLPMVSEKGMKKACLVIYRCTLVCSRATRGVVWALDAALAGSFFTLRIINAPRSVLSAYTVCTSSIPALCTISYPTHSSLSTQGYIFDMIPSKKTTCIIAAAMTAICNLLLITCKTKAEVRAEAIPS